VHQAHHGARAARSAEAVLLSIAGLGLTLAAGVLSGGSAKGGELWAVAGAAALLVGATWLRATFSSARETASSLDRRLGQGGALLTAYEAQLSGRRSRLVDLLAARLAGRVTWRDTLRAVRPPSVLPIAAPFFAAALLALALELTGTPAAGSDLGGLTRGLEAELGAARSLGLEAIEAGQGDDLGPSGERLPARLTALLTRVADLDPNPPAEERDSAAATLRRLQDELEAMRGNLASSGPLAESLRRASNLVDAAALRLADASRGGAASEPEGSGDRTDRGSAPPLASERGGGRMSDLETADGTTSAPPPTVSAAAERGASVGISWPEEYDEIVARWVESERAAEQP
jgi:hypothetical protein